MPTYSFISPHQRMQIRSYYESNMIDLSVVPAVNFRHFRFRLADGSFYKVRYKIHDSRGLREHLIRKAPLDVYYSVACWLNPHLLGSRVQKDILKNVMISCDLVFDIDVGGEIKTLEDARQQTITLHLSLIHISEPTRPY